MVEKPTLKKTLGWLCRLILGGAFICAGIIKAMDPQTFATDIDHYRLLPFPVTLVAGIYLPWLELVGGVAVLTRWRERGASLILAALCFLFCAAIASAWFRGLDITCGCFGHATTTTLPVALVRSLALACCAIFVFRCSRSEPAVAVPPTTN